MPVFYQWRTHYEITKKQIDRDLPVEEYLSTYSKLTNPIFMDNKRVESLILSTEVEWLLLNKPYYNIHSNIVNPAKRMKLDKIPCNFLDMPANLPAVVLNFEEGSLIRNIFVFKYGKELNEPGLFFLVKISDINALTCGLKLDATESIEDNLSDLFARSNQQLSAQNLDTCREAIRYFALAYFLSNCPNEELLSFDIANKYKSEWSKASSSRREEIIRMSKKKGKNGWNVGVNSLIIPDSPRLSTSTDPKHKYEQQYAHIRTGHIHCVRFGPGRKDVKIMWFRPTIVNKEKPFKVS